MRAVEPALTPAVSLNAMDRTDALKRYLDAGMAFTQLTRKRAEQVVKDLVAAGDLQRSQAKEAIDELVERSRKNTDNLAEQVRKEVDSQLANMGLARKADVERLEAEVQKLRASGAEVPVKPAEGAPTPPAKAAKKAPAKPDAQPAAPVSGELPARKAPAKKVPAKKVPAKLVGDEAPVSGALPAEKASAADPAAKKAPAKKAPTRKAASDVAPVSGELPAKRAAKVAKKQA